MTPEKAVNCATPPPFGGSRFAGFSLLESPWWDGSRWDGSRWDGSRWDGSPSRHSLRAFSLVELLVVIAIVAVLLGILLSVLGPVKRRADVTADVAHQRQVYLVLHQYMDDHDGRFPAFPHTPGTDTYPYLDPRTGDKIFDGMWWFHSTTWGALLMREGYNGAITAYSHSVPARGEPNPVLFDQVHIITFTAYAEPEFYVDPVGQPPTARQRVQRRSDVLYPSHKGVLILLKQEDDEGFFGERFDERNQLVPPPHRDSIELVVTFGDGHSAAHPWNDFTPNVMGFNSGWEVDTSIPTLNTPGGIEGRDIP